MIGWFGTGITPTRRIEPLRPSRPRSRAPTVRGNVRVRATTKAASRFVFMAGPPNWYIPHCQRSTRKKLRAQASRRGDCEQYDEESYLATQLRTYRSLWFNGSGNSSRSEERRVGKECRSR